jgi:hypothetical protein
MGLTAAPIVRFMQKLQEAKTKKQPYYALAHEALTTDEELDVPGPVARPIGDIKELFVRGIDVAHATSWGLQAEFLNS